ncbi:MAG TPA: peptide ABC transporter substrate-binding protein [Candidatus Saccharimonadales bacterium]|jgi:peptide/nickel transport system substrate-binding protein|nr:peptide ABC transporter substrate-binding protein [Candidatus Saccharimonadales bacterium]
MQFRLLRLRFRRRLRKGQRQVEGLSAQAEQQIETHLLKRFERLGQIRRFVIGWVGLLLLLIIGLIIQIISLSGYFQTLQPVPGGIYNEGVLGRFTNANPIYATTDADTAVSHLIFSGLLKYDTQGKLVGDLASGYTTDDHGIAYTVHLRSNLTWQDGRLLTSADVLFTYELIQNPDAQSPLQSSWQGITVTAPDAHTIVFKLPGALASFPYSLTNGIVPEHLLAKEPPSDLRSADFNTVDPVGTGPFAWQTIQVKDAGDPNNAQEQIALTAFNHYAGGQPKLQKFVVQVFASTSQLTRAFTSGQLTAAEGLDQVPAQVQNKASVVQHNLPLRAANMVFFKTSSGVLADQAVRHSLVQAANVPDIISHLDYPAHEVNEPLLRGQIGYDASLEQPKFDLKSAKAALDSAGWKVGQQGWRTKNGQLLTFVLSTPDAHDDHVVAEQLKQQWQRLGAKLEIDYLDPLDFQNAVAYHNYDAVLNGITIGEDPDVFVYWDSSQADIRSANRLNLSEYKSDAADASLEAGRSRIDPAIRAIKYRPFLQAWQQDSPALALYQPRLLYLTNGPVAGLGDNPINSSTDRFANVQNWEIRQAKITD